MHVPGQIMVVVRAGHTPCQAIVEALTHIDKGRLTGLILNDGHVGSGQGYYGYGYDNPAKSD
jgi:hypothetical protein